MKNVALVIFCALTLAACQKSRTPCVYELPEGFRGWTLVEFERRDAAPLPRKDGKLVFHFGQDGRLATSAKLEEGWAKDEYVYVGATRTDLKQTGWGGGGLIWGGSTGSMQAGIKNQRTYQNFFVGTEESFNSAPAWPTPK